MRELIRHILREELREGRTVWDDDKLRQVALLYSKRTDFQQKNAYAYNLARRKGKEFFDSITSHMPIPKSQQPYTMKELESIARQYKTKKEFINNNHGAYQVAVRKGEDFYNKITSHMTHLGSKHKRMIYAYVFPNNNAVYVGLTYNIDKRDFEHIGDEKRITTVRQYIMDTGEIPKLVKLTDYIDVDDASKKEGEFEKKFRGEGYLILNKVKTGGLGHGLKYTDNDLETIASNFKNVKDFYTQNLPAYKVARRKGKEFFKKITSHMERNQIDWSEDLVRQYASNFKNKSEFQSNYPGAASYAKSKGFWDDLYIKELPSFTQDDLNKIQFDYESLTDLKSRNFILHRILSELGLLDSLIFTKTKKRSKTLSDDDIIKRAQQYTNLKDFYTKDNTAYRSAKRKGDEFYSSVVSHMI